MTQSNFIGKIYHGIKAGHNLKELIKNAKNSIKIMSPYLEPALIDDLRAKQQQGVKVEIITTEETDSVKNDKSVLVTLINQYCDTDAKLHTLYKRYKLSRTVFRWIAAITMCYAIYRLKVIGLYAFPVIANIIALYFDKARKGLKIYTYTYQPNIPFIAFMSPNIHKEYRSDPRCLFFHTKLYIVDDVLITGSLNYTFSGLTYNFETMLISYESSIVQSGKNFFDKLFSADFYYKISPENIGKKHLFEKIYPS